MTYVIYCTKTNSSYVDCNKPDCDSDSLFTDYSKGFGGKYGVEKEKVDKAALGYDYKSQTEKHQSQKGEFKMRYLTHFV